MCLREERRGLGELGELELGLEHMASEEFKLTLVECQEFKDYPTFA